VKKRFSEEQIIGFLREGPTESLLIIQIDVQTFLSESCQSGRFLYPKDQYERHFRLAQKYSSIKKMGY
jgi:hypothetical protein